MKRFFRFLVESLPLLAIVGVIFWFSRNGSSSTPFSIPNSQSLTQSEDWEVVSIYDGDTMKVKHGSEEKTIRFCGIDAPELSQPLGPESKANLQRLINRAGGEVQLSIIESDRYGRNVAEVFTVLGNGEEKLLQEEQLKSGMALVYHQYVSSCPNGDSILKAEEIARKNRAGVWGDLNTVAP